MLMIKQMVPKRRVKNVLEGVRFVHIETCMHIQIVYGLHNNMKWVSLDKTLSFGLGDILIKFFSFGGD